MSDSPGETLAEVAHSAVQLAKAEVRLAVVEAKVWLGSAGRAITLGLALLLQLQIFVLLVAVCPLLFFSYPWQFVALTLAIAGGLLLLVAYLAIRELRRLNRDAAGTRARPSSRPPATALDGVEQRGEAWQKI